MGSYKKTAIRLIILFGLVSLFGDIVYEGARSAALQKIGLTKLSNALNE